MEGQPLKILYLVHNLGDAAVARRVEMMRLGGAEIVLAGFRRAGSPAAPAGASQCIDLGETYDANFGQRLAAVVKIIATIRKWFGDAPVPDIIMARNLEMLAIADRLQRFWPSRPPIAYECLDIHRLLLRPDMVGRAMRAIERRLMANASVLLTSSPAFDREYFEAYGQSELPIIRVENKVMNPQGPRGTNPILTDSAWPRQIGWFGALRCRKSLDALAAFAHAMEGRAEIILRGRPALTEFADFEGIVARAPHLRFEGAYGVQDLADIYSQVHFVWAIDFFEEGGNSKWLLPNRIYEGCLNGAIPIALEGTETANALRALGIGIVIPDVETHTLVERVGALDDETVRRLAGAIAATDRRHFAIEGPECHDLVEKLARLRADSAPLTEVAA